MTAAGNACGTDKHTPHPHLASPPRAYGARGRRIYLLVLFSRRVAPRYHPRALSARTGDILIFGGFVVRQKSECPPCYAVIPLENGIQSVVGTALRAVRCCHPWNCGRPGGASLPHKPRHAPASRVSNGRTNTKFANAYWRETRQPLMFLVTVSRRSRCSNSGVKPTVKK